MTRSPGSRRRANEDIREIRKGYHKVTVNIAAGKSPDGEQHRRFGCVQGCKRDAQAKRPRLLDLPEKRTLTTSSGGTVGENLDTWLEDKRPTVAGRTSHWWEGLV